jgi:hypothetical protein
MKLEINVRFGYINLNKSAFLIRVNYQRVTSHTYNCTIVHFQQVGNI